MATKRISDKQRLDWLTKISRKVPFPFRRSTLTEGWQAWDSQSLDFVSAKTPRAAIDAALRQESNRKGKGVAR